MKHKICGLIAATIILASCNQATTENAATTSSETSTSAAPATGQSGVVDDVSNPNIVQVASGSADHTTLVAAVKAAGLVDALSNAGPFTVFAPTNAGFDKLPKGTVEDLVKPENKEKLKSILEYHTYIGVLDGVLLQDGAEYDMVDGGKVKITKQGDKAFVNGFEIIASIRAANGMVHVINDVLTAPAQP